eukprot:10771657-Lingulodinium_polyedra.AAC.1
MEHYKKYGRDGTYIKAKCSHKFSNDRTSAIVYVFPKTTLAHAIENADEMRKMLQLVMAETPESVRAACTSHH